MMNGSRWKVALAVAVVLVVVVSAFAFLLSNDLAARNDSLSSMETQKEMDEKLIQLSSLAQAQLSEIERVSLNAASELRGQDLNGSQARGVLASMLDSNQNIVNVLTVNAEGIILAVEPSEYSDFEGTDVSADPYVQECVHTGRSYLSPLSPMYKGYGGVVIGAPIIGADGKVSGMLTTMFRPDHLIENITAELGMSSGMKYTGMVLQKDGVILYDVDASQVGKNTFSDPLFANFTEIRATASRMVNESSGLARYTYYQPGVTNPVTKEVAWTTISCLGVDWTVAVIRGVWDN